jgi:hypothetical protein
MHYLGKRYSRVTIDVYENGGSEVLEVSVVC